MLASHNVWPTFEDAPCRCQYGLGRNHRAAQALASCSDYCSAAATSGEVFACDSTSCLLVTRSASGLLPRKGFRLDLSYRATDDSRLMSGSDAAARVARPKLDFEHGIVRPGFHQDLGGACRFLQVGVLDPMRSRAAGPGTSC